MVVLLTSSVGAARRYTVVGAWCKEECVACPLRQWNVCCVYPHPTMVQLQGFHGGVTTHSLVQWEVYHTLTSAMGGITAHSLVQWEVLLHTH